MGISQDAGTYVELVLCTGCVHLITNGGCEGCESCFGYAEKDDPCAALAESFAENWPMTEWHVATVADEHGDTEAWFSIRECDGCGDAVHGDRFDAIAMPVV